MIIACNGFVLYYVYIMQSFLLKVNCLLASTGPVGLLDCFYYHKLICMVKIAACYIIRHIMLKYCSVYKLIKFVAQQI